MCCLRHPEHHARNRTSLAGLEQDLLFFGPPYISASNERNLKMKALKKTKSLPPSASKSVKPFGYETDFNGEGSNGT